MSEYWITKEWKKLKISNMETNHIRNCVRLCNRTICKAINYAANKNDESLSEPPSDWYDTYLNLCNELKKREEEIKNV